MSIIYTTPDLEVIRHNPLWRVELTNGVVAYQNNFHEECSSWIQLKKYLENNQDIFIKNYWIQFRDNIIHIGGDAQIYFFMRKFFGSHDSTVNREYYLSGCTNDINSLHVKHFVVPELVEMIDEADTRDPKNILSLRGIIVHPSLMSNFKDYYAEKI